MRTDECSRRGVDKRRCRAAAETERVDDADAATTCRHDGRFVGVCRRRHMNMSINADDRCHRSRRGGTRTADADATSVKTNTRVALRTRPIGVTRKLGESSCFCQWPFITRTWVVFAHLQMVTRSLDLTSQHSPALANKRLQHSLVICNLISMLINKQTSPQQTQLGRWTVDCVARISASTLRSARAAVRVQIDAKRTCRQLFDAAFH